MGIPKTWPEVVADILRLRRQGLTLRVIADRLGVCRATVHNYAVGVRRYPTTDVPRPAA